MKFSLKHRTIWMALVALAWLGALPPGASAAVSPAAPAAVLSVAKSLGDSAGELMTDGSVNVWGDNQYGQLGDGTNTNYNTPRELQGLAGVKELSFGSSHLLAVKMDGTVWVAGNNSDYELGDGSILASSAAKQVNGVPAVVSAQAGKRHNVALTVGGAVYQWGSYYLSAGQQAIPTTQAVYGMPPGVVQQVAAGGDFSLAIVNGAVHAWGRNDVCQLGYGTAAGCSDSTTPVHVQLPAGKSFVKVTAGDSRAAALATDGTVFEWGHILQADNSYKNVSLPTQVQANGFANIQNISCGHEHCLALQSNGAVWSWGGNENNEIGLDASTTNYTQPVPLSGMGGVTGIAANNKFSMTVNQGGAVYAWGNNNVYQLGTGDYDHRATPTHICPPVAGGAQAGGLACLKVNGEYIQLDNIHYQYTLPAAVSINNTEIMAVPTDPSATYVIDQAHISQKLNYYHLNQGTNTFNISISPGNQSYQLTVTFQKDPTAQPPKPIYAFSYGVSFFQFVLVGFDKELDQEYVSPNGGLLNDLTINSSNGNANPSIAQFNQNGKSILLGLSVMVNSPSQIKSVSSVKDAVYSVQGVGSDPLFINVIPADTIGGIVKMIQSNADVSGNGSISQQDVSLLMEFLPSVVVPSNWTPNMLPLPDE